MKYINIGKICINQWTNTFQMTNAWNYKTTQASVSTQNTSDLIGCMVASKGSENENTPDYLNDKCPYKE